MIEITVGLWPLNANTSLWPRLQLDGRSGRPGLNNRLVAPLLWGCFTGVSRGFLTSEYTLSYSPDVTSPDIVQEIDIPLLGSVVGGEWIK